MIGKPSDISSIFSPEGLAVLSRLAASQSSADVKAAAGSASQILNACVRPDTGPVGLAVSGGSDSLALMLLASNWARQNGRELLCLTVDHGLRPEAAAEARLVADYCRTLGIQHQSLHWDTPKRTQAAARQGRHCLLADALRQAGGQTLLFGHTADDQAETFLIRARAGSGWYGLAGMRIYAVSPVWPQGRGIEIVRPLLGLRRDALREAVRQADWRWVEDPSNADRTYERVRVRDLLARMPGRFGQIRRIQKQLSRLRQASDALLSRWLSRHVRVEADGLVTADMEPLNESNYERSLSLLIQAASGSARAPAGAGLKRLAGKLRSGQTLPGSTLGGAWLRTSRGKLLLARDPGMAGEAGMVDNIWDGRFEIHTDHRPEFAIAAHGMARPGLPARRDVKACLIGDRVAAYARALSGPSFAS